MGVGPKHEYCNFIELRFWYLVENKTYWRNWTPGPPLDTALGYDCGASYCGPLTIAFSLNGKLTSARWHVRGHHRFHITKFRYTRPASIGLRRPSSDSSPSTIASAAVSVWPRGQSKVVTCPWHSSTRGTGRDNIAEVTSDQTLCISAPIRHLVSSPPDLLCLLSGVFFSFDY